jgi:signal transduction histidine kinase
VVIAPRLASRHGDTLLGVLCAALFLAQIAGEQHFAGERTVALATALAFAATIAWRRRAPLVPLGAGIVLIVVSDLAVEPLGNTGTFFAFYVLAIYSAGRHTSGRTAVAGAVLLAAAFPLAAKEPGQPFSPSDSVFIAVAFVGPFVAGRVIRRRLERERHLEVERDTRAVAAVLDERTRIARELHDVVAHAISVMVLQARGGRRLLAEDPDETRQALDVIEHAGEQALVEMRRLLGMLRADDEELALAPQPSLARIDELAARLGATGLPVEVTIEGDPGELPPGLDVSAYRIVQEALTNTLKHAGPARAQVIVRYGPRELELEVRDDGAGEGPGGGSGHGLTGMRERVAVYGGERHAGRRAGGGHALRVRLPLDSAQ